MNRPLSICRCGDTLQAILPASAVGQLARACSESAQLFEHLGIDYCGGPHVSVEEACARAGITCDTVISRLIAIRVSPRHEHAPIYASLVALTEYIEHHHHAFARLELARASRLMTRVLTMQGAHHPELSQIAGQLTALSSALSPHLYREERVLFPLIRALETDPYRERPSGLSHDTLPGLVRAANQEHEALAARLHTLREQARGFTPPHDADESVRALYACLESLERDLRLHIHLEHDVLYPRSLSRRAAGVAPASVHGPGK